MTPTTNIKVLLMVAATTTSAMAQPAELPSGKLTVATRHVPPFAIQDDEGNWSGIAIDLLREITADLNENADAPIALEFREMTLKEMLAAVEQGEVDLAAAALTVNFQREERMDFSHPYHASGLGIAVVPERRSGWMNVLERIFSVTLLKVVAGLFGLLVASGLLIYLVERHHNKPQFGGGFWRGLGSGLWWSIVTLTTVGYGDKAPKTGVGRIVAVFWMFSGILVISSFTAAITSALTMGQLSSRISGLADLPRVRVATVADSTSQTYLRTRHIRHRAFSEVADALSALDTGEVEAVVYDAPILRHLVLNDFPRLDVLPITFERQDYSLAMPTDSPLRERVNRAILREINKRTWEATLVDYLGTR